MLLLLILTFIIILIFELPGLIRKKYWKDLTVFLALLIIAFVLSLLQTIGIIIPSPAKYIETIINNLL